MKTTKRFIISISQFTIVTFSMLIVFQLSAVKIFAQDEKKATIQLSFDQKDSTNICKALVTSENKPVKGVEVHFYVKRMFSSLPIGGAVETNDNGEAIKNFPLDLPGDKNGNIVAIAKIEDNETYGSLQSQAEVKWGIQKEEKETWGNRSLSASRENAPMYLIVVSNLIIAVIWGTIIYIIFQVFRIKKESKLIKKKN